MLKFFSNTILAYLETDINNFINQNNCTVISLYYTPLVYEGEIMHNIVLYYTIPTE